MGRAILSAAGFRPANALVRGPGEGSVGGVPGGNGIGRFDLPRRRGAGARHISGEVKRIGGRGSGGFHRAVPRLAGVALSTTSVAVAYAVMLELGFNRTRLGKAILAACFVNDLGTVIALGPIFSHSWGRPQ